MIYYSYESEKSRQDSTSGGGDIMNKKILSTITLFLALLMIINIVPIAQAKVSENDMGTYTEYVGELGGSGFVLVMPEDWNGMLVVFCHGYAPPAWSNNPKENVFSMYYSGAVMYAQMGYAYAYSTYGDPGYCIQKGIIRTHQLTQWAVDHFDPTDVFIIGHSMGGQIALMLADKYPKTYSGVLDIAGVKDTASQYDYQDNLGSDMTDMITEFGGTPEEKLKVYNKASPLFNNDLKVPTITIYGNLDFVIEPGQHDIYEASLSPEASANYMLIMLPGEDHVTAAFASIPYFFMLVDWATT